MSRKGKTTPAQLAASGLVEYAPGHFCAASDPRAQGVPGGKQISAAEAEPKVRDQWYPYRNKTEWRYAQKLLSEPWWRHVGYETMKLRVGSTDGKTHWYLPDFPLLHWDGHMQFHEVKGGHRWRDRGLAVLRAAAIANPWAQFWLVEPNASGGWSMKRVEG